MAKKINFNVLVDEKTAMEFEKWHKELPGTKGEKTTGALKAIQALYLIDHDLAYQLMKPNVSLADAVRAIILILHCKEYLYSNLLGKHNKTRQKLAAEFYESVELQAEFGEVGVYVAFKEAKAAGRVNIKRRKHKTIQKKRP